VLPSAHGEDLEGERAAQAGGAAPPGPGPKRYAVRETPGTVQAKLLKAAWSLLGCVSTRAVADRARLPNTLSYIDCSEHPKVVGHCALTIDDGPTRHGPGTSLTPDVLALLEEYQARATFFLVSDYVLGNEADVRAIVAAGHELGHHCTTDQPYHRHSPEAFTADVEAAAAVLQQYQERLRWFRAPWGRYTAEMEGVVSGRGMRNVMTDAFACCPRIPDPQFIANFLLKVVQDGSIIVLHMPEAGFRVWTLEALRLLLQGLAARGLRCVTVGDLVELAALEQE